MYLSTLKLWNFRKFGIDGNFDLNVPHQIIRFNKGINILIGENDSGKSAIVDAIKLVLKTHSSEWIKIEWEDFYNYNDRLRIECLFEGMDDDNEAKNFTEWLGWTGEGEETKPYLRVILDVSKNDERILASDIRAGAETDGHILTAEAREKLKITYLRPLRDAKSELIPRRNSRLSQILMGHEAFQGKNESHSFVDLYRELNQKIEAYFLGQSGSGEDLPANDQHGRALKAVIDKYLSQFLQKGSKLKMAESDLKSILESLCLLFEDGYNLGLGSHNLLSIASELLHLQKANWDGLRLGLIEEIEAHLHPQVQLQVIETIQSEANDVQLIFTTHSPNIGAKIPLARMIICKDGKVFPMGNDYTKLQHTDYNYLQRFLDVTKANLFFAKGVILVEGWAEEIVLPVFAKKIGVNLTEKGISIVNIGNTAFLRYSKIFQRNEDPQMEIPVSVITDVDVLPFEAGPTVKRSDPTNPAQEISVPLTTLEITQIIGENAVRKTEKYEGGPVKCFISPFWTFEYCIARSEKLRKTFYKSVLEALREQKIDEGVTHLDNYDLVITNLETHFQNWTESIEIIAFKIYQHILNGVTNLDVAKDKVSKTIISQRFAYNLEALDLQNLTSETSILYLLNAINHAAGNH
jgi:putative ATP-dependent endonuclease of the OLD family